MQLRRCGGGGGDGGRGGSDVMGCARRNAGAAVVVDSGASLIAVIAEGEGEDFEGVRGGGGGN